MDNHQDNLLAIFHAALASVEGKRVVSAELSRGTYPNAFHVIAIGKAADSMTQGVPSDRIKSGLVISKHGHVSDQIAQDPKVICLESDHPVPKQNSINAGKVLLDYIANLPGSEPCVFLLSGGASALVEVLEESWDLTQLQELTDYLLANAYPIDEINAIRKRLSKIKGGGLWQYLDNRPVTCLMISDVPGDDPAMIGSGLLFSDTKQTAGITTQKEIKFPSLPSKWRHKLNQKSAYKWGGDFNWKIIASLSIAKQAAANKAQTLGYQCDAVPEFLEDETLKAAIHCVEEMKKSPNVLKVWGGETTVHLPDNPGLGGRNQHLALSVAQQITGVDECYLIAAGTDGTDGLTTATGAMVDNNSIKRGVLQGLSARDYLQRADSHSYFKQTEGIITTGATGTNVMDLVLGIYCV